MSALIVLPAATLSTCLSAILRRIRCRRVRSGARAPSRSDVVTGDEPRVRARRPRKGSRKRTAANRTPAGNAVPEKPLLGCKMHLAVDQGPGAARSEARPYLGQSRCASERAIVKAREVERWSYQGPITGAIEVTGRRLRCPAGTNMTQPTSKRSRAGHHASSSLADSQWRSSSAWSSLPSVLSELSGVFVRSW
jgi:hypothetical protein